jgi:hypothetical protein
LRMSSFICFLEKYPDWICMEHKLTLQDKQPRSHVAT